jgi:hypothetical protein
MEGSMKFSRNQYAFEELTIFYEKKLGWLLSAIFFSSFYMFLEKRKKKEDEEKEEEIHFSGKDLSPHHGLLTWVKGYCATTTDVQFFRTVITHM